MSTQPSVTISTDPWSCPNGQPHKWAYLGRNKQAYRCEQCGQFARKTWLKEETDNAQLPR